jgi:hypothetical protein
MAQQVPFHITSGLPFGKTIEVTLPPGRSWWTAANEFEVLGQIREADDPEADLIIDLAQFITVTFAPGTDPDLVTIELTLNGADTRKITRDGHYDIVMSDVLTTDARATKILEGVVYRDAVLTADKEAITS